MKIIHTSDLHLFSPLSSRLPSAKVTERKKELNRTLERICAYATEHSVSAIIIAGDLFDTDRISTRAKKAISSAFEKYSEIEFFYLAGNHERDTLTRGGDALPENLHIFGRDWTYFTLGDITLAGRYETEAGMFDSLDLPRGGKSIVCLHGELCDKSCAGGAIGLPEARGRGISYMALGHYHSYSVREIERGSLAVYCGCPEGRGFDEAFECGFSLIDSENMNHEFIPFAVRKIVEREIDITGARGAADIDRNIRLGTTDIPHGALVRCILCGEREIDLAYDTDILKSAFQNKFYYFDIKDKTRLAIHPERLKYDKTLKGEFIRLCLSDASLSEQDRETVIRLGISALEGEVIE